MCLECWSQSFSSLSNRSVPGLLKSSKFRILALTRLPFSTAGSTFTTILIGARKRILNWIKLYRMSIKMIIWNWKVNWLLISCGTSSSKQEGSKSICSMGKLWPPFSTSFTPNFSSVLTMVRKSLIRMIPSKRYWVTIMKIFWSSSMFSSQSSPLHSWTLFGPFFCGKESNLKNKFTTKKLENGMTIWRRKIGSKLMTILLKILINQEINFWTV